MAMRLHHAPRLAALTLAMALAGCANMPGAGLSFKTGELPPAPTDRKWAKNLMNVWTSTVWY